MPQPKRQRARKPAAERKVNAREVELRGEMEQSQRHIANLQARRQQLAQEVAEVDAMTQQMLGRQRYIAEKLGEVPPLVPPEPEPQEEGDGGG